MEKIDVLHLDNAVEIAKDELNSTDNLTKEDIQNFKKRLVPLLDKLIEDAPTETN